MKLLREVLAFGIYRPVSTIAVFAALVILGIATLPLNRLELFPPLIVPVYKIITEYPDVPAEEVEKMVTLPLENILSTLGGVQNMESLSRPGISSITLVFDWGSSNFEVGTAIRQRIDTIYPSLPDGIRRPVVLKQRLNDLPALTLAVLPAAGTSSGSLRHLILGGLKPEILAVEGVADCAVKGLKEEEIQIEVDGEKLKASELSITELVSTLRANLTALPMGTVREGKRERPVISKLKIDTYEELGSLPVSVRGGTSSLTLSQIAQIRKGDGNNSTFFRYNGKEGIGISLKLRGGSGVVGTVQRVKDRLPKWQREFSESFEILIVEDTSLAILQALKELIMTIVLGGLVCFLTLLVLFNTPKVPWISLLSLPVTLTITVLVMTLAKITFNAVSLSGIALALGMVADNGIVLLEGLYSSSSPACSAARGPSSQASSPKPFPKSNHAEEKRALKTVSEAAGGVLGSTITSTLIFLPILFLPGPLGKIFRDLSLSLCILLWASLFTAIFFIPAVFMLLKEVKEEKEERRTHTWTSTNTIPQRKQRNLSLRILDRVQFWSAFFLRHPRVTLLAGTTLFLSGVISLAFLPYRLVPELPTGKIQGSLLLPPNTSIQETRERVRLLESKLERGKGIKAVLVEAGAEKEKLEDRGNIYAASNIATLFITLSRRHYHLTDTSIKEIADITSSMGFDPLTITRVLPPLYTLLYQEKESPIIAAHPSRETLYSTLNKVLEQKPLRHQSYNRENLYKMFPSADLKQWVFQYNTFAPATLGLTYSDIASPLRISTEGIVISSFLEEGITKNLRLKQMSQQVDSLEKIRNIPLGPKSRGSVGEAGNFVLSSFTQDLIRINRSPSVYLLPASKRREERNSKSTTKDILTSDLSRRGIKVLPPKGKEYGTTNILLFLLSLVLMYLAMGVQFNSFSFPLFLLFLVPLSAAGSLTLLLITGRGLNLSSFLGILITTGLCLNGGIILFDRSRKSNYPGGISKTLQSKTLLGAVRSRTLSIVASSLTTLLSLVPMVFLYSGTNEFQSHCAIAVIGGTLFSIPGVLFILPLFLKIKYGHEPSESA